MRRILPIRSTIQSPQKKEVSAIERQPLMVAVVAVVIIVGLIERIVLLRHSSLQPDLTNRWRAYGAKSSQGNPETFLWGQPYGGAGEIWPVALMIKIFGPSLFAMRALTVALGAVLPHSHVACGHSLYEADRRQSLPDALCGSGQLHYCVVDA